MPIKFEKPIGAHADCKELEYIATLHQTGKVIRKDGSVTADDVANLLTSRHGIRVDVAYIENHLMPSLAGAMDDTASGGAVFDIVELASMLIIPHLRKVGASEDDYDVHDLFDKVLKMILLDVTDSSERVMLNREMMIEILEFYGEDDVPAKVIDDMLRAAGADPEGDTDFDCKVLLHATTGDIQQVSLDWENTATTHYDDVLDGTTLDANKEDNDPDEEISTSKFDTAGKQVQRIFTAPTIDFVAENYRSKGFNIIIWLLVIVAFFAYAFEFQTTLGKQDCSAKFRSEFACRIVNSIISWLLIFAQLTILGSIFVALSTAGNSIYLQHNLISLLGVLVGIASITITCFLSYVFEFEFFLIDTRKVDEGQQQFAYIFTLALGCILLFYQIKALLYVLIPRSFWKRLPFASFWLNPAMAYSEKRTKQAAAFKINKMMENAIGHHEGTLSQSLSRRVFSQSSSQRGAFGQAVLNFQATADLREQVGGVRYTIRKMWDGSIFNEEGVWLHARLYAMNLSQWFVAMFYLIFYAVFYRTLRVAFAETYAPTSSPAPTVSPAPTFSSAPTSDDVGAELAFYASIFEAFLAQGEEFVTLVWENITAIQPELVALVGAGLINNTSPEVIQYLVDQASSDMLETFVRAASDVVDLTNILNTTETNVTTSRRLQDNPEEGDAEGETEGGAEGSIEGEVGDDFYSGEEAYDDDGGSGDLLESLIPTEGQTLFAVTMGGVSALIATMSLATVWLPSSVSTILQFRCGALPSLYDSKFQRYRASPDLTTILFGSTFWGTFYSSGVIFIFIGGLSFILVWEITRTVVMNLLAQMIGIFVTIGVKMLLLIFIRKALFVGFYRTRPAGANVTLLIFECWSLGLTVGTMAVRMVKLILISAFYIGRLDTPLFAEGVGHIGPVPLDAHPIQFRKDLLLHEAHRHPYIERLSVIYILKLRYGEDFGTRAGGAWRLIFVMALMPWLRRYRLDDGPVGEDDDAQKPPEKALDDGESKNGPITSTKDGTKAENTENQGELDKLRAYVRELEQKLEYGAKDMAQDEDLKISVMEELVSPM